jgi:hypothetical protein
MALSTFREPGHAAPGAPCRTSNPARRYRARTRGPDRLVPAVRQHDLLSPLRAPCADRSRSVRPLLALQTLGIGPPLAPRCCAPRAQPPTCVHSQWLCARPKSFPGFRQGFLGHMPPIDFCSCQIQKHPAKLPRPCRFFAVASYRASGNHVSFEPCPLSFHWPGVWSNIAARRFCDPHCCDRSPQWIYPNRIDSHIPCRELAPSMT